MLMIDTHIHLADIDQPPEFLTAKFKSLGICRVIAVSTGPNDWDKVAHIADICPDTVIPAFGLHPWYIRQDQIERDLAYLENLLKNYPKALIGECGFDRLRGPDLAVQQQVFALERALAQKSGRPLLIHAVRAVQPLAEALAGFNGSFVLHGFTGAVEHLKAYPQAKAYISVNLSFFRKKNVDDVLFAIDPKRLLVETDAPFQGSQESLPRIIGLLSEHLGQTPEETATQIYQNTLEFLQL